MSANEALLALQRQLAEAQKVDIDNRKRALLQEIARIAERIPTIEGQLRGLADEYKALGDKQTAADLAAIADEIRKRAAGVIEFGAATQ